MNIFNVRKGYDTGGWGWRLKDAFSRLTDWTFHSMYVPNGYEYIQYPVDLEWDGELAKRLYAEADVVHLHNGFATADIFERHGKRKPAIVQYHGTAFRQNPTAYLGKQRQRGSIGVVSTLDLLLLSPDELEWLPSPYNLEWLREQ